MEGVSVCVSQRFHSGFIVVTDWGGGAKRPTKPEASSPSAGGPQHHCDDMGLWVRRHLPSVSMVMSFLPCMSLFIDDQARFTLRG